MHRVTSTLRKAVIPYWIGERMSEIPPPVFNMASRVVTVIPVPLERNSALTSPGYFDNLQSITK